MIHELAVLVAYLFVIVILIMVCVLVVSCTVSLIIGIIEELREHGNDRVEELPFLRSSAADLREGRRRIWCDVL